MKRAKLALTAIGVMAIVAGALAFKAHNKLSVCFCRIGTPGACTTIYLNTSFAITTTGNTYCTFNRGAPCIRKVRTFIQP